MEGVEFQIRSHENYPPVHYPLSLDQRIAQGDAYRRAKERLEQNFASIEQFYSTPEAGTHSGQATGCSRCDGKKRRIRQAYHEYYLSADPDSWDVGHHHYREQLGHMFEDENCSLQDIYNFHTTTLREHHKADFAASLPEDTVEDRAFKSEFINYIWDNIPSLADIFSVYPKQSPLLQKSQNTSDFVQQLQSAAAAEQRAQLYIKYYCTIDPDDLPVLKNFKTKYARQFAELNTHDAVLAAMQEESDKYQVKTLEKLRERLSELQLAKSATMKHKKRRAEQADQRMLDRDADESENASCALPSCPLDVDLSEEAIECVICDWMVKKGAPKHRVYYCSTEHADEDFDDHDRRDHKCSMGHRCYFHPEVGPPGKTGACGMCSDCADHNVTSYFCSQECYAYNLELHRNEVHYMGEIENNSTRLEEFKPAEDIEVVS